MSFAWGSSKTLGPAEQSLNLIGLKDKVRVYVYTALQVSISILDTFAILLMGILASIGFVVDAELNSSTPVGKILQFFNLEEASVAIIIISIAILIVSLLISRTLLSLLVSKRIYGFLGEKGAEVSENYIKKLMSQPFAWVRGQSINELAFALTQGIQYSIIGVIGQLIIFVSELFYLIILLIMLMYVNVYMALVATVFFMLFGSFVYSYVGKEVTTLSEQSTNELINGNLAVQSMLNIFREIRIMSRTDFFVERFTQTRSLSGSLFARVNWLQLIPKFSVEVAVVMGALFLGIASVLTQDFESAIVDISIFLAATSRLAPSALRLQQSLLTMRAFAGLSEQSFKYYRHLDSNSSLNPSSASPLHTSLPPENASENIDLEFQSVSFRFADSETYSISEFSMKFPFGKSIAIVGSSGSGKSTLCDLALGLLTPNEGRVMIGDLSASDYIGTNPGSVAYLPQETYLIPGSIAENIAFGLSKQDVDDERLKQVIKAAQLEGFVFSHEEGLNRTVGENGTKVSGGEKQRIGLARALYSHPKLILLDEPTSALDGNTEELFMEALLGREEPSTMIMVAHKLSTLKYVDLIVYLANGKLIDFGTLDEMRAKHPSFATQANLESW